MSVVIEKNSQRIFAAIALLFTLALSGCPGGGGDSGPDATIPPYSGTFDIAVNVENYVADTTVNWDASSGDAFRVYWSLSANSGGTLLTPDAGVTTGSVSGPVTVYANSYGSGFYVWITRVSGSSESAPYGPFLVPLISPLTTTGYPLFSLSGNAVSITGQYSGGTSPQQYQIHLTSTATEAVSAATLQSSGVDMATLSATIPQFLDANGAPRSYYFAYVAEASGSVTGNGAVGSANYVSRMVQRQTVTPTLDELAIPYSGTVSINTPLVAVSSKYVVWSGNNQLQVLDKSSPNANLYSAGNIGSTTGKDIVINDVSNAAFYTISSTLYKGDLSGGGANQSVTVSTPLAPVALAVDATYVYVADASKIMRYSQADITAANTTLDAARAGLTDMAVKGTSLYLATSSGIEVINNLDTTPTAPTLLFGTTNPIKAIAIDDVNNKLYYIAASLTSTYGADAIFELNLASPSSAVAIQENIFDFSQFHFRNGSLYWKGNQLYQYDLVSSTLMRRASGGQAIIGMAADDDDSVYVLRNSSTALSHLPAGYSYAAAVSANMPVLTSVTAADTALSVALGSSSYDDADAVLYFADGVFKGTATTLSGLTNGTTYAVTAKLANASGVGVASAATNGSPQIGVPTVSALAQAGQVTFSIQLLNPTVSVRSVTAKLYVGSSMPVAMTTPAATATKSMNGGPALDAISLVYTTPNDNPFFYNVVVTEDATGSTSEAFAVASSEPWSNSAPAGLFQTGALYPSTGNPAVVANMGAYIYMSLNGSIYRANSATLATTEQVTTLPALHGLATVDGAELYGFNSTTGTVYAITQGDNATVANVGSTVVLDSSTAGFTNTITAIDAVAGTVFVGDSTGKIWAADWNGSAASNQRLVKDTAGGGICQLQAFGNEVFWSQKVTSGVACVNPIGSSTIRSTLADGSGVVTDLVTMPNYYVKHFQAVSVSGTPYLYYSEYAWTALTENQYNQIKRMNLSTQVVDTPVAEATNSYFAVATNGSIYFDKGEGVIYTLDQNNRRIAHVTAGPNSLVSGLVGIKLLKPSVSTTKLYVYGDLGGTGSLAEVVP